jgi:hypothetical protein
MILNPMRRHGINSHHTWKLQQNVIFGTKKSAILDNFGTDAIDPHFDLKVLPFEYKSSTHHHKIEFQ